MLATRVTLRPLRSTALLTLAVLTVLAGLSPGSGAVRATNGHDQPAATLVLADGGGLRAARDLLEATVRAQEPLAGVCLPVEALASATPELARIVAGEIRPTLQQRSIPACLVIRPPDVVAADDGAASQMRDTWTRARQVLGEQIPIAEARLDLSQVTAGPEQAGALAALVARVVHDRAPGTSLTVVLGQFAGVDAARPSGASTYLAALGRWREAERTADGGPEPVVSLALDQLPPRIVALAQDWLRVQHVAFGVQFASGAATPPAAEHAVRLLLEAGGSASLMAIDLPMDGPDAPALAPATTLPGLLAALRQQSQADPLPRLELANAPAIALPGLEHNDDESGPAERYAVDSNSPVHWEGDTLHVFTSVSIPRHASGGSLTDLGPAQPVRLLGPNGENGTFASRWLEATYRTANGTLYGWYHEEPADVCPDDGTATMDIPRLGLTTTRQTVRNGLKLTAPRIGAMRSDDDGDSWRDLGIILEAPAWTIRCVTPNLFFAGGLGDFAVLPDRENRYLYFLYSSYLPELEQQGIGVARINRNDLDHPVDNVWRWTDGGFDSDGIGGQGAMVYPVTVDWHRPDAIGFWCPTIHWNTYLKQYVILMNRAGDADFSQEGSYVAFADRLDDPLTWTIPRLLHAGGDWYAEAIGTDAARRETDTVIGPRARYYEHGVSHFELLFHRPGE